VIRRLAWLWVASSALALGPPGTLPNETRATLQAVLDDPKLADGFTGALVIALGHQPPDALRDGRLSVLPYDGGTRPELFASNADKLLAPASSCKLFTSAAALDVLGGDYTFLTQVVGTVPDADGFVPDVWLVGGGDPSLGYEDLANLTEQLAARGVRRIGRLWADASRYGEPFSLGWSVDDLPWYYAPEVSALTLARNHVDVYVAPGPAPGQPAKVWCDPANDYVTWDNQVVTVDQGGPTNVEFDRAVGGTAFELSGTIPVDRTQSRTAGMAIWDVPRYTGTVFATKLKARGIAVDGIEVGSAPPARATLATHRSVPLRDVLQRLLKNSDNLYAELLLREIGVRSAGQGTAAGGLHGVRLFLQQNGFDPTTIRLYDGSGLSRYTLVTPRSLCAVLRTMALHEQRDAFYAALPIAGVDGTIGRRMKGTPAEGRVRAKTGSYSHHTSLTGYVPTRDGDLLAVCNLWNHCLASPSELRGLHDRFFVALAGVRR